MYSQNKKKICFLTSEKYMIDLFKDNVEKDGSYEIFVVHKQFQSEDFNLLDLVSQAKELILTKNCEIIISLEEVIHLASTVLEAEIIKKIKIDKNSFLGEFSCDHKLYSRMFFDTNNYPYTYLVEEEIQNKEKILEKINNIGGFPIFMKPFFGFMSVMGGKANNVEEIIKHFETYLKNIPKIFSEGIFPFFEKYVDVEKYPLFVKKGMILEKFFEIDRMGYVEGYIYEKKCYVWATVESCIDKKYSESYSIGCLPSRFSKEIVKKMEKMFLEIGEKLISLGMDNRVFNVEMMINKENDVEFLEVNGRCSDESITLYDKAFKANHILNYVKLLEGIKPPIPKYSEKVTGLFYFYLSKKDLKNIDYEMLEQKIPDVFFLDPIDCMGNLGENFLIAQSVKEAKDFVELKKYYEEYAKLFKSNNF